MPEIYNQAYITNYPEGDYTLDRDIPGVALNDEDIIHTVKEGETLQNIAFAQYNDSSLWYVIAEANDIGNPFKEVYPGLRLRIPKYGLSE